MIIKGYGVFTITRGEYVVINKDLVFVSEKFTNKKDAKTECKKLRGEYKNEN